MIFKPKKASKGASRLRLGLVGPAGSGKTFTALRVASRMASRLREKILVIDTERGSASKYGDRFDFDVIELVDSQHPAIYADAILFAEKTGYGIIVIDSLSHAWVGKDGALALVDAAAKRSQSGSSFAAWRDVTPQHNHLVETMLNSKCHVIATLRAKTEYVLEQDERGKSRPRKLGLAPVQREGLDYEFDVVGTLNWDHEMVIDKTRCPALTDKVIAKPGEDFADILVEWLAPPRFEPKVEEALSADLVDDVSELIPEAVAAVQETKPESAPASFLTAVEAERGRIGDAAFAEAMRSLPIDYRNAVLRSDQITIYNTLRAIASPTDPASKTTRKK